MYIYNLQMTNREMQKENELEIIGTRNEDVFFWR